MAIAVKMIFVPTLLLALISAASAFTSSQPLSSPSKVQQVKSVSRTASRAPNGSSTSIAAIVTISTGADVIELDINNDLILFCGALLPFLFVGAITKGIEEGGESSGSKTASPSTKASASEKGEEQKNDVTIPYDAAARLSYDDNNAAMGFDEYNKLFKERASSEVKIKTLHKKAETITEEMESSKETGDFFSAIASGNKLYLKRSATEKEIKALQKRIETITEEMTSS